MGITYNPKVVTDGLVLCVDAASKRSYPGTGTTWTDLSSGENSITLNNGPSFSDDNGGVIEFDGTDDNGEVPHSIGISGNDTRTFCLWFYPISVGNNYGVLETGTPSRDKHFAIEGYTSTSMTFNGWYHDFNFVSNGYNKWQYLCLLHDGSQVRLYIDTELRGSRDGTINTAETYSYTTRGLSLAMGRGGQESNIRVSSLDVYNKALSDDEIRQNYNATRGRFQ